MDVDEELEVEPVQTLDQRQFVTAVLSGPAEISRLHHAWSFSGAGWAGLRSPPLFKRMETRFRFQVRILISVQGCIFGSNFGPSGAAQVESLVYSAHLHNFKSIKGQSLLAILGCRTENLVSDALLASSLAPELSPDSYSASIATIAVP